MLGRKERSGNVKTKKSRAGLVRLKSSLLLKVPLRYLQVRPNIIYSVPYDLIVQRASSVNKGEDDSLRETFNTCATSTR